MEVWYWHCWFDTLHAISVHGYIKEWKLHSPKEWNFVKTTPHGIKCGFYWLNYSKKSETHSKWMKFHSFKELNGGQLVLESEVFSLLHLERYGTSGGALPKIRDGYICGHIDPHFQTSCHWMTPFLFSSFCSHLMTPIFKMLSHFDNDPIFKK